MPVILLYMFAYSIASYALQFHNSPPSSELLKNIFFPGYFIIGGENYKLEGILDVSANTCSQNFTSLADFSTDQVCPEPKGTQVSIALYVVYLLFMYILVQNLLIAIFSDVYEAIDKESDKVWKYERYSLSYEYFHKPPLPPPFVLIYYVFYLGKLLLKLVRPEVDNKFYSPGFYYTPRNSDERNRFVKLEFIHSNQLLLDLNMADKSSVKSRIDVNADRMDQVYRKFDGINETRQDILKKLKSIDEKFKIIMKCLDSGKTDILEDVGTDKKKKSLKKQTASTSSINTPEEPCQQSI